MSIIRLRSGGSFDLANPRRTFTYDDLLYPLAHINRFGGQVGNYSVLAHSVLVARITAEILGREDLVSQALHHDFPEALYGDMVSPLRRLLPEYDALYARGEAVVFEALGLPPALDDAVKEADRIALSIEVRDLLEQDPVAWGLSPARLGPMGPLSAWRVSADDCVRAFLNRVDRKPSWEVER